MKKPSIAFFIYNTKHCGGNKVVFENVNRLKLRGYSVEIYTIFGQHPDWFNLKTKIKNILNYFFNPSPDILICTFWPTAYLSLLLYAKRKIYFVLGWEEEFYRNHLIRFLARFTYKLPVEKMAISKFLIDKIKEYTKTKMAIHLIMPYGLDLKKFKPDKPQAFNYRKNPVILSVISSYSWYKGVDLLEKAVVELKKVHPDYKFVLVSSSETKPYSSIFDKFYCNIKNEELIKLYQNSDLFLSTGRAEGFYIPGLEAMACGCPFISTDSGGILEYAKNHENAIIINNIRELWEKDIVEKLLNNINLIKKLRFNGLITAKKYHWDTIIDDLEKIFLP